MASDCSWPLPSWTANFPNLAACQNLLVFKLNSLSKMPFWSLPPPRGLLEVPGPLSLASSSGFSWLLLAVSTLRPFGQFLYLGPPCASKIGLLQAIHAFFAGKVKQIGLLQRIHTFFCGQSGCQCRHSAAIWPISIPQSALCVENWPPAANPVIF